HSCESVATWIHCAVTRTRLPALRTLPSRTVATFSFCATVGMSTFVPLKLNAEVREATRRPRIFESTLSNSSARPSAKYSFSSSRLMFTKGSTAIDGMFSSIGASSVFRATLRAERALRSKRGLDGACRSGERRAEGVACGLEDVPAARLDALPQQSIVARQRFGHRLALRLPEPSAALDIREQKRDRAARRRWRTGTMFDNHSIFYASGERETVANRSRPSERGRPPESGGRNASP